MTPLHEFKSLMRLAKGRAITRAAAIAEITAKLSRLDDERVQAVADIIDDLVAEGDLPRELTERELALIEQAKADFAAGRTYSAEEARAYVDAEMARRRAARAKA